MHLRSIRDRLQRLTASWPGVLSLPLRDYLRQWERKRETGTGGQPYWLFFPAWLLRSYHRRGIAKHVDGSFLGDILWGQYCLFLCVRIQDDLLDGQAHSHALMFVSDQLLIEGQRVFAKHIPRTSRFWKMERQCLEMTTAAIVSADNLQRSPAARPQTLLPHYARIAEVFKVGPAAVCTVAGRTRDFGRISLFADNIAVVSQIMDDVDDVVEDVGRGRYNYVASLLMHYGNVKRSGGRQLIRDLAHGFLHTNATVALFRVIHRHIDRAARAIAPLQVPEVPRCIEWYEEYFREIQKNMHRARVRQFQLQLKGPHRSSN
jgi:hypothetical protein